MIILRAVLLLILDEVTSSVDVWTEELIQKSYGQTHGRPDFLCRCSPLTTICNADLILVVRDGHIIE